MELNNKDVKSYYKFSDGGYLIKCDTKSKCDTTSSIQLTKDEFDKINKLNDNIKELYDLHKEHLELIKKHNKGTIQHALKKLKINES